VIVKVQLPVSWSPDVTPEALAYNEDGSVYVQIPITPELVEAMERLPKKFFHAEYSGEANTIRFTAEAPWQEW